MPHNTPRIALVHDYLREYGGAERVLEQLHEMYPQAPVYTAFFDKKSLGPYANKFAGWDIRESKIAKLPLYKKLFSPYRVFASWAFEQFDLSDYDIVISSTNAYMAKAVRVTNPKAVHISYIHTPSRALYGLSTRTNWKQHWWIRLPGQLINFWMRYVDFKVVQRPDILVANSTTTARRITKFYRRASQIIHPPVQMVETLQDQPISTSSQRKYLLFVGRLVLAKHPEVAVEVSNQLNLPLKVVGVGPMLDQLKKQAGSQVEFLGAVPDEELAKLYQYARLLLFPAQDEDFGIVPIEAMAAGTPVIAHQSGEPEFIIKPNNGALVSSLKINDWAKVTKQAWSKKWDYQPIKANAAQFSSATFAKKIHKLVNQPN